MHIDCDLKYSTTLVLITHIFMLTHGSRGLTNWCSYYVFTCRWASSFLKLAKLNPILTTSRIETKMVNLDILITDWIDHGLDATENHVIAHGSKGLVNAYLYYILTWWAFSKLAKLQNPGNCLKSRELRLPRWSTWIPWL